MKIAILFFAAILGTVVSAPQGSQNEVTIVQQEEHNNIGVGGYKYSYELSDGQKKEETAELVNEGTDEESLAVKGSFTFVGPDGQTYVVTYTADKDGFRPVVQHLPK